MNKPLVLAAAILGVIFLVLACVYWFVPGWLASALYAWIRRWLEPCTRQARSRCSRFGASVTRVCVGQT